MTAAKKYNAAQLMTVVLAPVVSEKSTLVADKNRQYVFRVADHATGAARVRRSNNCDEIADMDFAPEYVPRNGTANDRPRDVVEKARQHEHNHQQRHAAHPAVR